MGESEKKRSFGRREIVVLVCVIGFFIWVSIPNFVRPRATGGGLPRPCLLILRDIDAAAMQFALEHHLTNGDPVHFPNDLTPYIKLNNKGEIPGCPQGGTYSISKVGERPTCSLGTTVTPAHVLP